MRERGGDARGNPSFRKRKGSPWTPSEGNHFRPHPPPEGGVGCGLAAFKDKRIRPGAPSARRDRKPEAAFLGESARGAFFQKKESPSPKTPFPRKPLCRVRPSKGGAGGVRYFAVSRIISLNAPHGAFKSGGAGGTASCRGLGQSPNVPFVLLVPYRLSSLSRVWIAFFSMRETYEREMPSFSATSYWGRHSPSSRP